MRSYLILSTLVLATQVLPLEPDSAEIARLSRQAAGLCAVFWALDDFTDSMTSEEEEKERARDFFGEWKWPLVAILGGISLILVPSAAALIFGLSVPVEIFPLMLALIMYCCFESEFDFEPFEDREKGKRLDLGKVRESMGKAAFDVDSSASTKKLRQKMARKYGHLSHTVDWSNDKKWWQFS